MITSQELKQSPPSSTIFDDLVDTIINNIEQKLIKNGYKTLETSFIIDGNELWVKYREKHKEGFEEYFSPNNPDARYIPEDTIQEYFNNIKQKLIRECFEKIYKIIKDAGYNVYVENLEQLLESKNTVKLFKMSIIMPTIG